MLCVGLRCEQLKDYDMKNFCSDIPTFLRVIDPKHFVVHLSADTNTRNVLSNISNLSLRFQ